MRFYDKDIVAARAEPGLYAIRRRTAPLFRCGDALSAGAIPARPDPSEIPDTNAPGLGFPARSRPAVTGRRGAPAVFTKVPAAANRSERNLDDIPRPGDPFFEPPDDIVNARDPPFNQLGHLI